MTIRPGLSLAAVHVFVCAAFVCTPSFAETALIPPLKAGIQQKYEAYIAATEARIEREVQSARYLWSEQSPRRWQRVRKGEVVVEPWNAHGETAIEDGLLHDWIGALFVADMSLARVVGFLQDYNSHKNFFRPEVVDSRLLSRDGDTWRLRYRVVKRYLITVVVNTDQTANFHQLTPTRMITRSFSTRIAEVEHAGKPDEHELDPRKDRGVVWRLNTYWRLEERDGGVYIECQTISLTRAAPFGLGWLVNPIIRSLPGASLAHILESTRRGALSRR